MSQKDRLECEVHKHRNDGVPCIGYCHFRDGCWGMTVVKLGEFMRLRTCAERYIEVKGKTIDRGEYHVENTLSASFLRRLNKCMRTAPRSYEIVDIVAYIAPLSVEDRERIFKLVPMLQSAEILK